MDQRRGQVRVIPPLPHGRRASPGLQRDGRRGNDGDLGRVDGLNGGGGVERHRCGLRRHAEGTRGVLGGGSSTGIDDDGEAGQGWRGVTRSPQTPGPARCSAAEREDHPRPRDLGPLPISFWRVGY